VALRANRDERVSAGDLRQRDGAAWKALRQRIAVRHGARRLQARFRRDRATYLTNLETQLLKRALPP